MLGVLAILIMKEGMKFWKYCCSETRCASFCGRFICIYPAYLNNKKTIAEGRRIPISKVNGLALCP